MQPLPISEVARRVGLRPSAIRYYERIGILPPAQRIGGKRRYDETVFKRLVVVQFARESGFTLGEIRQLFLGFQNVTPASERWKRLSRRKLTDLQELMDRLKTMQRLLHNLQACRCSVLDECGKALLRHGFTGIGVTSLPLVHGSSGGLRRSPHPISQKGAK
jgi:MerR family transcriptional regulator, redox-sensitive transcriptional activator SoxR